MTLNIDKLLRKRGWTGEEVGKALVASLLHDIKYKQNKLMPDYKPLFTQDDFNRMHNTLKSPRDFAAYGVYEELFHNLRELYNRALVFPQSFYHGFYRLYNYIEYADTAEAAAGIVDHAPLIVTQSQYDRLKADAVTEMENFKESFASLLMEVLYFAWIHGDVPAAILNAIDATRDEIVTNERVIDIMKIERPDCDFYGVLPDGHRSDKMTGEDWRKAVDKYFLDHHEYIIDGKPASEKDTRQYYRAEMKLKLCEILYKGIDGVKEAYFKIHGREMPELPPEVEKELIRALETQAGAKCSNENQFRRENPSLSFFAAEEFISRYIRDPLETGVIWHKREKPPEWSKYAITECIPISYYKVLPNADAASKRNFKEYKADYPKVFAAIEAFIKKKIPSAKSLKPSQYHKPFITWKELAKLGFLDYKRRISEFHFQKLQMSDQIWRRIDAGESNEKLFRQVEQIYHGGISIIQNPSESDVDENGDFIMKNPVKRLRGIEYLEEHKELMLAIHENLVVRALKWLYGFNALMPILGAVFRLGEMDAALIDLKQIESQCRAYNSALHLLYTNVYGSERERQRKRSIIKECILPIDIDAMKPTKESIIELENRITYTAYSQVVLDNIRNLDALINELQQKDVYPNE